MSTKEKLRAKLAKKKKRAAERGAKFATREEWLSAAALAMRPMFDAQGAADFPKFRVSCGWPKGGRKAIGQAWHPDSSGDATAELFISPALEDVATVMHVLMHELVHAVVGNGGHKGLFRKLAKSLGLEGKMTATVAGKALAEELLLLTGALGAYPHAELSKLTVTKQGTRMLRVSCPNCGCILRMTAKWLEQAGVPRCGCGADMVGPE